jgi:hypothetical protein
MDSADRDRCTQSVRDARQRIIRVYERLVTQMDVGPILQQMESDCIAYLDFVESRPDSYIAALHALARQLESREQRLKDYVPALQIAPPGSRTSRLRRGYPHSGARADMHQLAVVSKLD